MVIKGKEENLQCNISISLKHYSENSSHISKQSFMDHQEKQYSNLEMPPPASTIFSQIQIKGKQPSIKADWLMQSLYSKDSLKCYYFTIIGLFLYLFQFLMVKFKKTSIGVPEKQYKYTDIRLFYHHQILLKIIVIFLLAKCSYSQNCTIFNCQFCLSGTCVTCNDEYVWDNSNNCCSSCLDAYCKVCTAPNTMNACQICLDGFAILGLGCSSCSNPFCQVCGFNANGTTCLTCINGYVSNAGICEQCSSKFPNCLACSLTACTDCQPGSVISGIYCIPCSNFIPGCSLCSSTTTCTACEIDGYYFDSGASRCAVCLTSPLLTNCAVCEHEGKYCESCVPNFGLFGGVCLLCDNSFSNCAACNSTACLNCTSGFYFGNSGCSSCSFISSNCLNCNSTQCTLCDNGFYVNSSQCSPCSTILVNCTSCSSTSTCSSCITGNIPILNGSSTSCVHCSALFVGCLNCDQSKCNICDYNEGYYRDANKTCTKCDSSITNCGKCYNFTICEACTPTSAFNSSGICQYCSNKLPGCLTCSNLSACLSCISNCYHLHRQACFLCSIHMPNCLTCTSQNISAGIQRQCTSCHGGFHLNFNKQCICDIGELAGSFCSSIAGCAVANSTDCLSCMDGMYLFQGQCICANGYYLVTGICVKQEGCVAAKKINNTNICLFCDVSHKYILINGTCGCKQFYYEKDGACTQICGDNIDIDHQCDDGNTVDGDGCSSICMLQTGFSCSKVNGKTRCIYKKKIVITLVKTQKISGKNVGRFTFKFQPNLPALAHMDFKKYLSLLIKDVNSTIQTVKYQGGYLMIDFSYSSGVQGKQANLNLSFDPQYFDVSPSNMIFPIKSQGMNLGYLTKYSLYSLLDMVFLVISLIAIIIFAVSLPFHKMIGVETIQVFQIFFVSLLIFENFSEPFDRLKLLNYTVGMVNLWNYNSQDTLNARLLYNRLGVVRQFFQNTIVIFPFLMLLGVILAVSLIKTKKNDLDESKTQRNIRSLSYFYKKAAFPIIISMSYGLYLSLYSKTSKSKQWVTIHNIPQDNIPQLPNTIALLLCCTVFSLIFWVQIFIPLNKFTSETLNIQKAKNWYVSQYLIYSFILMASLLGGYQISSEVSIIMTASVIGVQLAILLYFRPYNDVIHNFSIILNQSSVLFLSIILYQRNQKAAIGEQYLQEDNILVMFLIIMFLIVIQVFAVIRLVVVIRNRCISGKKVYDIGEDIASGMLQEELLQIFQLEKINEPIILGNKYSLINPLFDQKQNKIYQRSDNHRSTFFEVPKLKFMDSYNN